MAAMDMDDEEDMWANTTSPSASPPQPGACSFISTQLSLNSRLHLLSSSAASPPDHCGGGGGGDGGIYGADGGFDHHHLMGGGGGFRNAASVSPGSFFPYGLDAVPAPLDAGAVAGAAAWAGGTDRRKKRMIKNRESAARSRARKQAYIRELEMEVKRLQQENESLRVKYDQLRVYTEVPAPSKTKKLQRTPSASC